MTIRFAVLMLLAVPFFNSCRGQRSGEGAIHLNVNMDHQARFNPQTGTWPLPEATVPRSRVVSPDQILDLSGAIATGSVNGVPVSQNPLAIDKSLLIRGQERFGVHCAVCHGLDGSGKTPLLTRGLPPPTPLMEERVRGLRDGDLFQVITSGARNMGALGNQISPEDRWAVVAWVRVLQTRETGRISDMPADRLKDLGGKP